MMTTIENSLQTYLQRLCVDIPHRHVGSPGNQTAVEYVACKMQQFGFVVETPEFDCIDWVHDAVQLTAVGETFVAYPSPYSLGCELNAPLIAASTVAELSGMSMNGRILLLHGELAKEQLMPKAFPFYNPESHQQIIALLEKKQPAAIIAATGRNPELAGGWYPFPLFEDGDFDIPSVYMKDADGEQLLQHVGSPVKLEIVSQRIPARSCNVVARKGVDLKRRLVICAHIDTKKDTPGALDNGTGVTILLGLAERLANYRGNLTIEIVALNGEDYYSAPGQLDYLAQNAETMDSILLAVNMDLAGAQNAPTIFSLFGLPDELETAVRPIFAAHPGFDEGPQWYQSDHSIFIQNGRPAIAITSANFMELSTTITHTDQDTIDLVDISKPAEIVCVLSDIVNALCA
ncbi:MAG: M28 family peptidase [Anaerolineales bacterium]|nr:M28 family peptidase [Anaerolineales bacterium]